MTILNIFKDNVKIYPDNTAVIYENRRYTYREIDEITSRLACRIVEAGGRKGLTASVLVPRCEYMPIVPLALMKAGMAYVPLDYTYPAERLEFIVSNSESDMIIGTEEELSLVNCDITTITLPHPEDCRDILSWSDNDKDSLCEVKKDDLFTILYTSGTTGNPKGVLISHRSPVILSDFMRRKFRMTEEDIHGNFSSYGFDACNMDIFLPLTFGASLCIIPQDARMELDMLYKCINQNGISTLFIPTAISQQYIARYDSGTLRCILTGGEKTIPWKKIYDDCEIYNMYGPTEDYVYASGYLIKGDEKEYPIGKANDGNRIYIITEKGEEAQPGETGEICIAGPQLSLGYLYNEELTKKVFTPNPYEGGDYGMLYHTGDLGYYREDGNIMIVGRKDTQVKINGNRLELKEVESVVRQYPEIKDATVDAKTLPNGRKILVAYVVSDAVIDANDLCRYVSEHKPTYMVPSAVIQMDKIPLNHNGKVDHSSLPMPELELTDNYVAPRNETEEKLCNVFSRILGIQGIGIDHDLIELGGDSLSIMKILEVCNEIPGLNAALLIEEGTARKISDALQAGSSHIVTTEKQADYPIYGLQNDLYEFYVNTPGNKILHVEQGIRMSMEVDEERLRNAIITTINSHSALKVRFRKNASGEPRIIRNDDEEASVDICHVKESEVTGIAEGLIRYFDLAEEPCYRIKILVTEQHKYLVFDFHHFVMDGVSLGIFLENINRAYIGEAQSVELWTAFEMALYEEKMSESESYKVAREWFDETFSNLTCDKLPEGDLDPDGDPISRERFNFPLHITKTELEEKSKMLNTSATILADAAFAYNLGRYTNQQEAVFITISEGRDLIETQKTIGCFARNEPVYCKWNADTTLPQLLEEMKSMRYKCMVHSVFPFSRLSFSKRLMDKMIFVNQIYLEELKEFCGHEATGFRFTGEEMYFGISTELYVNKDDDTLFLHLLYRGSRYSEAFMRQYGKDFEDTLTAMMNNRMP